jgi:hypothetical protein
VYEATSNKTGNGRKTYHSGTIVQTLLQQESSKCYISRMCVFLALDTKREMCMRHIVVCVLPGTTTFFHIILQTQEFSGNVVEHKTCVLIFSTKFARNIFHSKKKRDVIRNINISSYFFQILMKLEFSRQNS